MLVKYKTIPLFEWSDLKYEFPKMPCQDFMDIFYLDELEIYGSTITFPVKWIDETIELLQTDESYSEQYDSEVLYNFLILKEIIADSCPNADIVGISTWKEG